MSPIARIKVRWSGFIGGPGVSTFYCLDPATFRPALITYWQASKGDIPQTVNLVLESQGDILDDVTGEVTGGWVAGTDVVMSGGSTDPYAAPSGVCVTWLTNTVVDGKHLRGRTFLVPIGRGAFDLDGSLTPASLSAFQSRAATLAASNPGQFLVWHRPIPAGQPHGPRNGSSGAVSAARVTDKVAILRSRRD